MEEIDPKKKKTRTRSIRTCDKNKKLPHTVLLRPLLRVDDIIIAKKKSALIQILDPTDVWTNVWIEAFNLKVNSKSGKAQNRNRSDAESVHDVGSVYPTPRIKYGSF